MTPETKSLGKYQHLEEIGRGGFGTVFRALDPDLGREVAIKVLDPLLMREPAWVARFRREAQVIARLDHPHIVTVHEIGQSESALYIVERLVKGGSLADRIAAQGALPWPEVVRMVGEMAEALDYAHAQGVIHRDLKSANVLLDPERGAQLTDFGFARIVAESSVSVSGGIIGTPQYIAPEVWENHPASAQTDVYALGCIVYEMVVGRTLFQGDTTPSVMRAHFKPLALPESWPEGVPAGLAAVLETALAKEPGARYVRAGDLASALTALEEDRLAGPYAQLQATVAAPDWPRALALAAQIRAESPAYRDVAALEQTALRGQEQAARSRQAAIWREAAETALQEGDLRGAERAARQWADLVPGDLEAEAFLARLKQAGTAALANVASPPEARAPTARRRRRPPWAWIVGGMALLAVVLISVFGLKNSQEATRIAATQTSALVPQATEPAKLADTPQPTRTPFPTPANTELAEPTATAAPSSTATPIPTEAPLPTKTVKPTAAPTATPTLFPLVVTVMLAGGETSDLYLVDSAGGARPLASRPESLEGYGRWSPDGERIVLAVGSWGADFWNGLVLVQAKDVPSIDPLRPDARVIRVPGTDYGGHPDWSPDGTYLVFDVPIDPALPLAQQIHDIWKVRLGDAEPVRLTDHPADDRDAVWSPDGARIAFSTNRANTWEIYVMNPDGNDQHPLTARTKDRNPAWSPDGRHIAFVSARDGNYEIYVAATDGTGQTRLTFDPGNDMDAGWTPDGRVLFVSDRTGTAEIYTINVDGTDLTRLTEDDDEDRWPDWRR